MDISVPSHIAEQISNRCLRCYNEQQWYGENFLFDYVGDSNVSGKSILEIGCAEAGLLKFYFDKGAKCSGMELSDIRFNNAVLLNGDNSLHLFQANICEPQSYDSGQPLHILQCIAMYLCTVVLKAKKIKKNTYREASIRM